MEERVFAVSVPTTGQVGDLPHALRFRFTTIRPVQIRATVNGLCLPECEYISSGKHGRELGVQVRFWSYEDPGTASVNPDHRQLNRNYSCCRFS
jgi:hypothetical protein